MGKGLTFHRAANAALHVLGGAPARFNQSAAQYVHGRVDVRVRLIPALDVFEDRLALAVLLGDVTALMAGLAGLGGGDDDKLSAVGVHLVLEPLA